MTLNIKQLVKKRTKPAALNIPKLVCAKANEDGPQRIQAGFDINSVGDQRLVYGQVYAPNVLDSHGHFMTTDELRKVAHNFLLDGLLTSIDVQHNNSTIQASIVESFIARKGDPDFEEGAWVAVVKIDDPVIWAAVKDGIINGYSFEILTYRDDMEVEFEYKSWYYGFTDPDPYDKHTHPFIVRMDENGEILWGKTGVGPNGEPAHLIKRSNVTEAADNKTHRIHLR